MRASVCVYYFGLAVFALYGGCCCWCCLYKPVEHSTHEKLFATSKELCAVFLTAISQSSVFVYATCHTPTQQHTHHPHTHFAPCRVGDFHTLYNTFAIQFCSLLVLAVDNSSSSTSNVYRSRSIAQTHTHTHMLLPALRERVYIITMYVCVCLSMSLFVCVWIFLARAQHQLP